MFMVLRSRVSETGKELGALRSTHLLTRDGRGLWDKFCPRDSGVSGTLKGTPGSGTQEGAFSWCSAVPGQGSAPKDADKGGPPRSGWRLQGHRPGATHKAGGGRPAPPTARHPTADQRDSERFPLRLIPTSMKTARPGPPAGPLSRALAGQLQPRSPPPFVPPPSGPLRPPHLSCLEGREPSQGCRLRRSGVQRGAAPLFWGRGGLTPGSAGAVGQGRDWAAGCVLRYQQRGTAYVAPA